MFFDKYYRPERYNEIVHKIDDYKNINEFRTHVIQNYYKFPLRSIDRITVMPIKTTPTEAATMGQEEQAGEEATGNILLEKRFLNLYTNVFKTELGLYFLLGNAIFYMGIAFTMKQFNRTFMLGLLMPGILANMACVYARTLKYNEFEMQISQLYRRELSCYKRFFHDEGYDDY